MPLWPLAMSCVSTLPLREPRRPRRHESVFTLKATVLSFIKQTACVSFIYHSLHIFLRRAQSIYFYSGSFPCASVSFGSGSFSRDGWGSVAPGSVFSSCFSSACLIFLARRWHVQVIDETKTFSYHGSLRHSGDLQASLLLPRYPVSWRWPPGVCCSPVSWCLHARVLVP